MEEDLLKYYEESEEEVSMEELIEKAIEYVGEIIEFKEPDPDNMLEILESEEVQKDTILMKEYNHGVKYLSNGIVDDGEYYDNALKFEYKGKEIIVGFSKFFYGNGYAKFIYDFTFLMKVQNLKRLQIESVSDKFIVPSYEKVFKDYEEYLDRYDEEHDEEYKEHFSDRFIQIKEKTRLNTEKYKLTDSDKEFLTETFINYKNPINLTLKDGVLCLSSEFIYQKDINKDIAEICKFIKFVISIFNRFLYI